MRRRNIFGKDWMLKLLSLGFAVLLWFFVVGEEKSEITIWMPIEIVNIPPGLIIANDVPPAVEVRVYGPRSIVRALATQRLSKVIDLRSASAGTITVHVTADSLPMLGGVSILRIQPSNIDIVLKVLDRLELPVKPKITGEVAKYHDLGAITVEPKRVVVAGPADAVRSLKEVATVPLDLSGVTATVVRHVALDLPSGHFVSAKPDTVKLTVQVTPQEGTRKFTQIPVQVLSPKAGVSWVPKTVTLTVRGPLVDLQVMEASDVEVKIVAENLPAGEQELVPQCVLPPGFTLEKLAPEKIKVTVPE